MDNIQIGKGAKNPTEIKFREESLSRGFELISKGWPDYIIRKGSEIFFVECKKEQKRKTLKMGMTKAQLVMKTILESFGIKYRIYRGDWEVIK